MKKTIALLAVGMLVGYLSTNSPVVKTLVKKGKRKMRDMLD